MAIWKNNEGYYDPTAGEAISNVANKKERTPEEIDYLVRMFKDTASLCGYDITERIVFRDRKTGKIWR